MFRFTRALLSSTSFSFIDSQCSLASNTYISTCNNKGKISSFFPAYSLLTAQVPLLFVILFFSFHPPSAYPKVPYIIKMAYCCRRRPDGRSRLPSQAVADSSPFSNDGANLRRERKTKKLQSISAPPSAMSKWVFAKLHFDTHSPCEIHFFKFYKSQKEFRLGSTPIGFDQPKAIKLPRSKKKAFKWI